MLSPSELWGAVLGDELVNVAKVEDINAADEVKLVEDVLEVEEMDTDEAALAELLLVLEVDEVVVDEAALLELLLVLTAATRIEAATRLVDEVVLLVPCAAAC